MTPPGPPLYLVQIEFTAGVWTDVTAYAAMGVGEVTVSIGRQDLYEDSRPATVSVPLTNIDGRFTPDNPTSPYYPNVVEWKRIRFTWSHTVSSRRFEGYVNNWGVPDLNSDTTYSTVQAVDLLGLVARHKLACDVTEQWRYYAGTYPEDFWPLDDANGATTYRNVVNPANTGRTIVSRRALGATQSGSVDTLNLDGAVSTQAVNRFGPVLAFDLANTNIAEGGFWFNTTDTPPSGGNITLATFTDATDTILWTIQLADVSGTTVARAYNAAGGSVNLNPSALNDGQWHLLYHISDFAGNTNIFVGQLGAGVGLTGVDIRNLRHVYLGGAAQGQRSPGKQTVCVSAAFTSLGWRSNTLIGVSENYASQTATETSGLRLGDFAFYGAMNTQQIGSESRTVAVKNKSGTYLADAITELASTIGGLVYVDMRVTGWITMVAPDAMRPATPTLTIAVEADDDGNYPIVLTRLGDQRYTRSTVTYPGGSATAVDTVQEALGIQVADQSDSTAATYDQAYSRASFRLNRSVNSYISQVTLDLATGTNDNYVAVDTLVPGARIRLTGLPAAILGRSQVDLYVLGQQEVYGQTTARVTFNTVAADTPPTAYLDNTTYDHVGAGGTSTVTSGTAVGTTATGTVVITSTGPPWTVDAAAYPHNLDWNGEQVTVTSAPASSTSPQTLTITTRGAGGTVARVHAAGETVDVAYPATAGP